jgi:putative ABC transport system substrate-binding protein
MRLVVAGLTAVALLVLEAPVAAEKQPARAIPRIGYLTAGSVDIETSRLAAFRQGLRELGYSEGQNIVVEPRYAEGRYERIPELIAELVRLKVDVLVATTIPVVAAAKKATSSIPIVMVGVGDPVRTGVVASLGRPGGNITGNTLLSADTSAKRVQLLREALPNVSRVAIIWNPANASAVPTFQEARSAARALGVALQSVEVSQPTQLDGAFTALTKTRPDALIVTADPLIQVHVGRVVDFAARHRLPAMYTLREHVIAGGLMSYGASLHDLFRRSATHVDKLLKGAKPADLPVEQPTKFELVINLKTAKTLGLTIPPPVMLRADEIIE